MFCGKCGNKISKEANFCMSCGDKILIERRENITNAKKRPTINMKDWICYITMFLLAPQFIFQILILGFNQNAAVRLFENTGYGLMLIFYGYLLFSYIFPKYNKDALSSKILTTSTFIASLIGSFAITVKLLLNLLSYFKMQKFGTSSKTIQYAIGMQKEYLYFLLFYLIALYFYTLIKHKGFLKMQFFQKIMQRDEIHKIKEFKLKEHISKIDIKYIFVLTGVLLILLVGFKVSQNLFGEAKADTYLPTEKAEYENTMEKHDIFEITSSGDVAQLNDFLHNNDIDINAKNLDGVTPLMIAATNNDLKVITLLLEYGATIDLKSALTGRTALSLAILENCYEAAKLLIQNGANLMVKDFEDLTAIDYFILSDNSTIELDVPDSLDRIIGKWEDYSTLKTTAYGETSEYEIADGELTWRILTNGQCIGNNDLGTITSDYTYDGKYLEFTDGTNYQKSAVTVHGNIMEVTDISPDEYGNIYTLKFLRKSPFNYIASEKQEKAFDNVYGLIDLMGKDIESIEEITGVSRKLTNVELSLYTNQDDQFGERYMIEMDSLAFIFDHWENQLYFIALNEGAKILGVEVGMSIREIKETVLEEPSYVGISDQWPELHEISYFLDGYYIGFYSYDLNTPTISGYVIHQDMVNYVRIGNTHAINGHNIATLIGADIEYIEAITGKQRKIGKAETDVHMQGEDDSYLNYYFLETALYTFYFDSYNTVNYILLNEGAMVFTAKVGMTFDEIKRILGEADYEGYCSDWGDEFYELVYNESDTTFGFYSLDQDSPSFRGYMLGYNY